MQARRSESMHNLLNTAGQSLKLRRDCHKFRSAYANLFLIYFYQCISTASSELLQHLLQGTGIPEFEQGKKGDPEISV